MNEKTYLAIRDRAYRLEISAKGGYGIAKYNTTALLRACGMHEALVEALQLASKNDAVAQDRRIQARIDVNRCLQLVKDTLQAQVEQYTVAMESM